MLDGKVCQSDARFDVLMLRSLHVFVVFYALSDYGTEQLNSDDFLVTWSRDQLLQKAYWCTENWNIIFISQDHFHLNEDV